jgi:hypothetical protein
VELWQITGREKMRVARCAKLIETYPKRLAAVIAVKGGSTMY